MTAGDALSLLAFVVAVYALYLSNLQRAKILLVQLPTEQGTGEMVSDGGRAEAARVRLPLFLHNAGARGGALLQLEVPRREGVAFAPPLGPDINVALPLTIQILWEDVPTSLALEGGTVVIVRLDVSFGYEAGEGVPEEFWPEFLKIVRGRQKVTVILPYRFLAGRSLLRGREAAPS